MGSSAWVIQAALAVAVVEPVWDGDHDGGGRLPEKEEPVEALEFADRRYVGLEELHAFGDCRR
jgi:hypothetical protein